MAVLLSIIVVVIFLLLGEKAPPKPTWEEKLYLGLKSNRENQRDGVAERYYTGATNAFRINTEKYQVPKKILYRTFNRESEFEFWARHRGSNCRGLGQISEILAWDAFLSGRFRYMHLFSKYPAPNPSTGETRRKRRPFVHPRTGKEYRINTWAVYHPQFNIELSCDMLRRMFDTFGSWRLALVAYNAGPGTLQDIIFADSYAAWILEEEVHYEARDYLRYPRRRRVRR